MAHVTRRMRLPAAAAGNQLPPLLQGLPKITRRHPFNPRPRDARGRFISRATAAANTQQQQQQSPPLAPAQAQLQHQREAEEEEPIVKREGGVDEERGDMEMGVEDGGKVKVEFNEEFHCMNGRRQVATKAS